MDTIENKNVYDFIEVITSCQFLSVCVSICSSFCLDIDDEWCDSIVDIINIKLGLLLRSMVRVDGLGYWWHTYENDTTYVATCQNLICDINDTRMFRHVRAPSVVQFVFLSVTPTWLSNKKCLEEKKWISCFQRILELTSFHVSNWVRLNGSDTLVSLSCYIGIFNAVCFWWNCGKWERMKTLTWLANIVEENEKQFAKN